MHALPIANWVCYPILLASTFKTFVWPTNVILKFVLLHRNATWHLSVQKIQHTTQSKAFGLLELRQKDKTDHWPLHVALLRRKRKNKQCCKLVWLDFCSFRCWYHAMIAIFTSICFFLSLAWNVNLICFWKSHNSRSKNFYTAKPYEKNISIKRELKFPLKSNFVAFRSFRGLLFYKKSMRS